MTMLTDGKRKVGVIMREMDGDGINLKPDWSQDFFGNGRYDREMEAFVVDDLEYCKEQALDWKYGRGDFYDDRCDIPNFDPDNRLVGFFDYD